MRRYFLICLFACTWLAGLALLLHEATAEGPEPKRNSGGRPKMPPITKPVMFDTEEADSILEALQIFPEDNPWNLVVSKWPVHPKSKNIIASIGADKPLRYNTDMSFILVPPDQKKVEVKLVETPRNRTRARTRCLIMCRSRVGPLFTSDPRTRKTRRSKMCSATNWKKGKTATPSWWTRSIACCTSSTKRN